MDWIQGGSYHTIFAFFFTPLRYCATRVETSNAIGAHLMQRKEHLERRNS